MKNFSLIAALVLSCSSYALAANPPPTFDCKISQRNGNDVTYYAEGALTADGYMEHGLVANVPAYTREKLEVELTLTTFDEAKYGVLANLRISTKRDMNIVNSISARYDLDTKLVEVSSGTIKGIAYFIIAECTRN